MFTRTLIHIAAPIRALLRYALLPAIVVISGATNDPPQDMQWEPIIAPTLPIELNLEPLAVRFRLIVCNIKSRLILAINEKTSKDSALGSPKLMKIFLIESTRKKYLV